MFHSRLSSQNFWQMRTIDHRSNVMDPLDHLWWCLSVDPLEHTINNADSRWSQIPFLHIKC
jgi:hypothetical protein